MALETKAHLEEDTIRRMQTLIRANIDSYDGFRQSASAINDEAVANLFRDLSRERSAMATELQNYVEWNGTKAQDDGSLAAGVHRAWINVRSKLSGGDAYVILSEAERGEDHIKQAYETVLKETAGSALNDVLSEQYARIKAGHDRVKALRDSYASRRSSEA